MNFIDLLPQTANIDYSNRLTVGGCVVTELAKQFGTPLYIYDEFTIRETCKAFKDAFLPIYPNTRIAYSSKAFSNPTIALILMDEGLGMDVVTAGELEVAKFVDFPAKEMNFHGNSKDEDEIRNAIRYGIGKITVDSFDEIEKIDTIAKEEGKIQKILLRVSPGVRASHTHEFTVTGATDSKFGFPIETGAAEEALQTSINMPNIELVGLHFHLGSPISELDTYSRAINYVIEFSARMRRLYGFDLLEFIPGGGFAVNYTHNQQRPAPEISEYARVIVEALKSSCKKSSLSLPILTVEPGRAIVARAGFTIYSVNGYKEIKDIRTYIHVDGGMADNIRPPLYGAEYTVFSVDMPLAPHSKKVTISGKFCESGDILAKDVYLPEGSKLIGMPTTGAYCLSMSSNYLMQPRPAAVIVNKGICRVIRRRETYADVLNTSINVDTLAYRR